MFAQVSGPRIGDKQESYFGLLNAWRRAGRSQGDGVKFSLGVGFHAAQSPQICSSSKKTGSTFVESPDAR